MDLLRGLDCVIKYGEFGVYRVLGVAVPSATDYASLSTPIPEAAEVIADRLHLLLPLAGINGEQRVHGLRADVEPADMEVACFGQEANGGLTGADAVLAAIDDPAQYPQVLPEPGTGTARLSLVQ